MAAAAPARKRGRNGRRLALIVGGALALLAACAAGVFFLRPQAPAAGALPEGWQQVAAERGPIAATISATGNVEAAAEASLRFATSGTITAILVAPGQQVEAGAPLAQIDSEGLELALQQAQADLAQAQADYEGLLAGASEQEIAEAQARVAQAQSQYEQTASSVSAADLAAARADVASAEARLARLLGGPASDELAQANEQVQRAQASLDQARVDLAAAKERARLDVETRANALRTAQDEYSRIYWQNRDLDRLPGDLPQERVDQEAQALRAVSDAEAALATAQTAYEQARQDEINTLATREAELSSAVASRDALLDGPEGDEIASARASLERARASLAELTGASRQASLSSQQSGVEIAQAGLDRLLADPSSSTLASRQAAVARAEISVRQAERNLAQATLTAPFAATIAAVDMRIGEPADGTAIIAVVDLSSFHVDVPIDELDIAQVVGGQRANIVLDALPGVEIGGTVTGIAPQATRSEQGTTTYEVTVSLDADSPGVRPGMTAVVQLITEEKPEVVLVPRRAVRSEGGQSYVLIYDPAAVPTAQTEGGPPLPARRQQVTLGLSNSEFVEVVSGLSAGEQVLLPDVVSTFLPGGPPQ